MKRLFFVLVLAACEPQPELVDPDLAAAILCGREQEDVFSGARATLSPECAAYFEENYSGL